MSRTTNLLILLVLVLLLLGCGGGGGGAEADENLPTAKAALIADHNALRTDQGLTQFTEVAELSAVTQTQAAYMASIGHYSFTDAEGRTIAQQISAAGLTCTGAAANVDTAASEAELWSYWKSDSAALSPITVDSFDQIGVGVVIADGVEYWCAIYASGTTT